MISHFNIAGSRAVWQGGSRTDHGPCGTEQRWRSSLGQRFRGRSVF